MTHVDPGDQKVLQLHCGTPIISTRVAKGSFWLAMLALAGGTVCIMVGYWPPGLILVFAGVAGVMTSVQARQMQCS